MSCLLNLCRADQLGGELIERVKEKKDVIALPINREKER